MSISSVDLISHIHNSAQILLLKENFQIKTNIQEPKVLETSEKGLFSIVEQKSPDPVSELLFTKVDNQTEQKAEPPKKLLIEEIED